MNDNPFKTEGGQWGNKYAFFAWYKDHGIRYFRIFGYGLMFKDWRNKLLLFSDREFVSIGKPVLIVGYWIIKVLKP